MKNASRHFVFNHNGLFHVIHACGLLIIAWVEVFATPPVDDDVVLVEKDEDGFEEDT